MSRIRIFTGCFGSSKTEVSISYEIKLAKKLYQEINIPCRYAVCRKDLEQEIKGKVQSKILPINIYIYIKPLWR